MQQKLPNFSNTKININFGKVNFDKKLNEQ